MLLRPPSLRFNQMTGTLAVQERSTASILLYTGGLITAVSAPFLIDRLGRRATFQLGFIGCLTSCLAMFLTVSSYGLNLLLFCLVVGFFATIPFISLCIYVPETFELRIRGTAFGFGVQIGRVAAAAAALLGGQLVSLFGGSYALAGASVALVNLLGLLATLFMTESSRANTLEKEFTDLQPVPVPARVKVRA